MHKFAKKVYISMLSITLVCVTMFATTYAWVGMLKNSQFDEFKLSIKGNDISEYGIELSTDGKNFYQQFGDEQILELKKQILKNWRNPYSVASDSIDGIINNMSDNTIDTLNASEVDYYFKKLNMEQATVNPNGNVLGQFINMKDINTTKYYKFDLYVSVSKIGELNDSDFALDIYLQGNLFSSKKQKTYLINDFTYPSAFVNNSINGILGGTTVTKNVYVKPESACRLAITKYDSTEKGNSEYYNYEHNVTDLIIFEGGSHLPTYDSTNDIYSFGGNLENQYNLALDDWNSRHPSEFKTIPAWAINRCDKEYNYNDVNQIISQSDGVGINTMCKLSFSFWFEGWDADCFAVIDQNPVDLSLNFTTKIDK